MKISLPGTFHETNEQYEILFLLHKRYQIKNCSRLAQPFCFFFSPRNCQNDKTFVPERYIRNCIITEFLKSLHH